MTGAQALTADTRPAYVPRDTADGHRHPERVAREIAYVVAGLPLGVLYLGVVAGSFLACTMLGALWLGLPLALAASAFLWRCARLERTLANRLLGARIPPLPPLRAAKEGSMWQRVLLRLGGRALWRGVTMLVLRLPSTMVGAAVIATGLGASVWLLIIGVGGIAGSEKGYFGPFALGSGLGVVLCLLAIPVCVLTVAVIDAAGAALRALVRALLVTRLSPGAPVRETLARSLGDRSLSIAYWLPDQQEFVDESGRRVPLPEPGSDRAWTAVDYEGRRVAAILHDVSLDASPELVQAAAAAASLALDNEQLKAELRARVEELRASRVRLLEASHAARRKVERDLHDGAQQQLVALAVELRLLRSRVGENPDATELIDSLEAKLSAAIEELRELARGLHPGVLTNRGLALALEALASRAPLPVDCMIDLPFRPPASVEAVAYFVMAEALTNVLRYAQASQATIRACYEDGAVVVEMQDDGVGGADERSGTGLQGLRDRVGALDGGLTVISPDGGGTLVRARIPSHSEQPVRP